MDSLFEDLVVVELASVLAGPAVGTFFSELGAEVIKIENKTTGGDVTRTWRVPGESDVGPSAYFASVNWNKTSLFLDLTNRDDKIKAWEYIQRADIVITNFKKGDGEKLGFSYEDVKAENPSVIYGHLSGFGTDSDRLAYDLILQAETGFMSMNGQPGSPPTKMPLALIDVLAAHQLKEGILCALIKQQMQDAEGCKIEVSLYDSAIASLINQATNWLMNGNIPRQRGSLHPNIAPYGEVFSTADNRQVTLAIGSDRQFASLCDILDLADLPGDPRFKTNKVRVEHRSHLAEILRLKIKKHTADPFLAQCRAAHVPAAVIKNMKEVFEEAGARALLLEEEMDGRDTLRPRTSVFQILHL